MLVPSLLPSALAEYRLLHHLERMKHHRPDISSPELPRLLADLAAAEEAVHAPPTLRCDAEPLFYFPWPYDDELVTLSRRGAPFGGGHVQIRTKLVGGYDFAGPLKSRRPCKPAKFEASLGPLVMRWRLVASTIPPAKHSLVG